MTVGMRHSIQNFKQMSFVSNDNGGGSRSGGVKKTAADNIRTATRSTDINSTTVNARTSSLSAPCLYGVGAARTKTGSGVHHNAKAFYSNDNFLALQQSNQGLHFKLGVNPDLERLANIRSNIPNNKMSGFEKAALVMALLNQGVTAGLQIANAKSTKNTSVGNSQKMSESDQAFNYDSSKFKMTGELKTADSFGKIKNVENEANQKLDNFGTDYDKIGKNARDNIAKTEVDINNKLQGTDVKLDIDLSKLSITAPEIDANDLSTLDKAAQDIGKDIKSVNEFKTKDLAEANKTIDTALTSVGQEISKLEGSLSKTKAAEAEATKNGTPMPSPSSAEIQKDLDKAKAKQTKLKDAQKELNGTMAKQADDLIESLQAKQNELGDIKQVKEQTNEKKFELAKEQNDTVLKNAKELNKLDAQIATLQGKLATPDGKDYDKNSKELNKLIDKFNGLYEPTTNAMASLKEANETTFTYKGKTIDISNALSVKLPEPKAKMDSKLGIVQNITQGLINNGTLKFDEE